MIMINKICNNLISLLEALEKYTTNEIEQVKTKNLYWTNLKLLTKRHFL